MPAGSFTTDIAAIRERARQKMEDGPVTGSYGKDPKDVIAVLNEVVATEIVCWMRYTRHAISATGINRAQVAGEFTEHAESERGHAMLAAERMRTATRHVSPPVSAVSLASRSSANWPVAVTGRLASRATPSSASSRGWPWRSMSPTV